MSQSRIPTIFLYALVQATVLMLGGRLCQCQTDQFTVTPGQGFAMQSLAPSYWLHIKFNANLPNTYRALANAVSSGKWDCKNVTNYQVTIGGKRAYLSRIDAGGTLGQRRKCSDQFMLDANGDPVPAGDLILLLHENSLVNLTGEADVVILGVPGQSLSGKTAKDKTVSWKSTLFTISAQEVNNENLNNKTVAKTSIYQFPISGSFVFWPNNRGGWQLDTKNLFSTNERDSQSAFQGGMGYQVGILRSWYFPLKLEQQVQGNQVATNLSTVSTVQVSSPLPRPIGSTWGVIDAPIPATFSIGLPYTHRINQVVAPGGQLLPIDDFAINPALALTGGRLLYWKCNTAPSMAGQYPGLCLNWEGDAGFWYLPLEKTSKGSQRVEGYWDASILIPTANFTGLPYISLDSKTQINQMQLRIKYQDAISPANNYARSKKWTFGLELTHK